MKICQISDVVKILIFAAAVIITCIIVALGFQAVEAAKRTSSNAIIRMNELNEEIKDSDIKVYDGIDVYGSDVINCIKRLLGDYVSTETAPLYVYVKTSIENIYVNSAFLSDIRNFSSPMYIKPTGIFIGEVVKNENKVIEGIKFIQK